MECGAQSMQGARQESAGMEFAAQSSRQGPSGPKAGEGSNAEALAAMQYIARACVKAARASTVEGREERFSAVWENYPLSVTL